MIISPSLGSLLSRGGCDLMNGAAQNNGLRNGSGGLLRDCNGNWLGGYACSLGCCSAYIAEL